MIKTKVYMLCGLPCSGKSTHASVLQQQGAIKLSIDEKVQSLFGEYGVDYPEDKYPEKEKVAKVRIQEELVELIRNGTEVILDFGFWKKADRDIYKNLIVQSGGEWELLYFKTSMEEINRRIEMRNKESGPNALTITPEMMNDFVEIFEKPANEDELVISP